MLLVALRVRQLTTKGEFQMKKRLLITIAGTALIAGCGLAAAQQRVDDSLGGTSGPKGSSQRELGGAAHERQPGAMQGQTHKRSGAIEEKERRSGETGEMQGRAQGRSGAVMDKEHRSGQSGAAQGSRQERSSVGSLSSDQRTSTAFLKIESYQAAFSSL
jgi:hypothetical protein